MHDSIVYKLLITWISSLLCLNIITSQDFYSRLISIDAGLPGRNVTAIAQDDQAYIWMATNQGICRYDGYDITNFGLPDNMYLEIWSLDAVSDRLFLLDAQGQMFVFESETFTQIDLQRDSIANSVVDVYVDDKGHILVMHTASDQIFCYDENWSLLWKQDLSVFPLYVGNFGRQMVVQQNDLYYALHGTDSIVVMNRNGEITAKLGIDLKNTEDIATKIFSIDDRVLISSETGIHEVVKDSVIRRFDIPLDLSNIVHTHNMVHFMHGVHVNEVILYSSSTDTYKSIDLDISNYPDQSRINQITSDKSGNYWLATEIGAIVVNEKSSMFQTYHLELPDVGHDIGKGLRSMIEVDNDIYFSTDGIPFLRLDPKTGSIENLSDITQTAHGHFHQMVKSDQQLITGSQLIYDVNAQQIVNSQVKSTDRHAWVDSTGSLFGCGYYFCTLYDRVQGDMLNRFFAGETRKIKEDLWNRLWICGANGLIQVTFDPPLLYYFPSSKPVIKESDGFEKIIGHPLPCKIVYDFNFENQQQVWLATSEGLIHFNVTTGDWSTFGLAEGLPNETVYSILPEGDSALWLGTGGGLCRFDLKHSTMATFHTEDGIAHNEFNTNSTLITSSGDYYMGGINGITRFRPEDILQGLNSENYLPLLVRKISFFDGQENRIIGTAKADLVREISVPPQAKILSLDVALADFTHPEDNVFSFWMEGLEEKWSAPSTNHEMNYFNLPSGKYTLRVKGGSERTGWSQEELKIPVIVHEAFYKTIWFAVLLTISISGLIFGLITWQYRQRLKLAQLRNQISRDLHDEVGGVLSGLAMQMDLLAEETSGLIQKKLLHIAEGSRSVALKLRDVIWAVDSSRDTYEDLEERMKAYALEMLEPLDVQVYFRRKGINPSKHIGLESRQNILYIFKEAINNIAKHAEASKVEIVAEQSSGQYSLSIADDGKGLHANEASTGMGLNNMQQRAQKIGGQINMSNHSGTTITIQVPWR